MMKYLVLGGTGAMGAPLVELLAKDKSNEILVTTRSHKDDKENIHYIIGNAKSIDFVKSVLLEKYDVIFDFMVYGTDEFQKRYNLFLDNAKQYFFFSSSRCYADSKEPIKEDSPRLVDICTDPEYLASGEYGLIKGKEEDVLFRSGKKNWTIIRPYITYNDYRIQLGVFEKENWLWRALNGRTIVMPKDIAEHYTSLTYGKEVAAALVDLISKTHALGEAFHITVCKACKWQDILDLYLNVIERETGKRPRVKYIDNSKDLCIIWNKWQIIFDRLYDRRFDNKKINGIRGEFVYTDCMIGLDKCLTSFLKNPKWLNINLRYEAWCDKLTSERTPLEQIHGFKNKLRYIKYRYFG